MAEVELVLGIEVLERGADGIVRMRIGIMRREEEEEGVGMMRKSISMDSIVI